MPARTSRRPKPLVLCVDDDPTARMIARLAMVSAGCDVIEAATGATALDLFANARPDLVFLDVHIGDVDGFEVCAAIRSMACGSDVPVVMLTGDEEPATIQRAFDSGATDFEGKDVPATVLSQRAHFLLRARATLEDLHESERGLEAAQRLARIGSWEWDRLTGRHTWSPMMRQLLGRREPPAPTHDDFLAPIHAEDRERVESALLSAQQGPTQPIDFRILDADGAELVLQLRAEPVTDETAATVGVAGTVQDVTAIRRAEDQIRVLVNYDGVTGLPNRSLFLARLRDAISAARRRGTHVGVAFLDLDDFKTANDTLGHGWGDRLLRGVADRLRNAIRDSDAVSRIETPTADTALGRLAGDEFVVLLADVQRDEDAGLATARLLRSLEEPFLVDGREVFLSASAGIALYPRDALEAGALVTKADTAMYAAKAGGRGALRFFSQALNQRTTDRLEIEAGLRRALERRELRLHYQPIVNSVSGDIVGAECLIRWQHPELGLLPPSHFIGVAEETGLIAAVTEWVVSTACAQHHEWAGQAHVVPLSFNVSSRNFQSEGFADRLCAIVGESGVAPGLLTIEVTEGVLLLQSEIMQANVDRLRAFGLRFAIDDFGTGYSSLGYLRRFPVDQIKVDRSFIRDLDKDPAAAAIAEAVSLISRRVGIEPVAEGVETVDQCRILNELGFERMQGFLFAKPMPADEFARFRATSAVRD
jgi:diguanylate cyclase (GGDEF)-like protein